MNSKEQSSTPRVRLVEIQLEQAGQRIDNFLLSQLKGVPKSRIYRCLRRGEVRVNKSRVASSYRLEQGDQVRIPPLRVSHPSVKEPVAPSLLHLIESSLLYEDKHLLILNKPAGIAVHSGSSISYGVIETLRHLRPEAPFLELVHRLDRETSGCLMVAKTRSTLLALQSMQREQLIHKRYLALVKGRWPRNIGQVNLPLLKNILQSGERVVKVSATGKPAASHFHPKQLYKEATLMEITLETGRTHQIRVHAAHLGHPLGGDEKYGDPAFNKRLRNLGLRRLFLHADQLSFTPPEGKKLLKITAPLPEELSAVLKAYANKILTQQP
ncbi:pseudouridine synthase, RluA family [Nitrosococcus halophilus Nc 4]|uniref:Pseudouridine synthase n=1 Tax=Nitrosococcus halophilus (strain Nc4) TaxID=472759 RepID=D5BW44_NITHN|nr:23S rRNA pseudouridine(955/2504/2580) synthase RluC [Nitrosococcus halophilus]ADE13694.1 pseudouridine synthase, RluA family [Nitrosococcus halophilus Nc 4]